MARNEARTLRLPIEAVRRTSPMPFAFWVGVLVGALGVVIAEILLWDFALLLPF